MIRVIDFVFREGWFWPLIAVAAAGVNVWRYARRGPALWLLGVALVLFVVPFFARVRIALRYQRVKQILLVIFIVGAVLTVGAHRIGYGPIATFAFWSYGAFAAGCLFWAASDPTFEMIEWLKFPTEYGRAPDEIYLLERRNLVWPGNSDPQDTCLFRFRYDGTWEVGLTGPVTFSLFGEGLDGKPVDEIYSAYRDWMSQEGMSELRRPGPEEHRL